MTARLAPVLRVLLLLPLLGAAPPAPRAPEKQLEMPMLPARLAPRTQADHPKTRCELCHTASGWHDAHFPHERTGFPLLGAHGGVTCQACHTEGFDAPLPRQCSGCHRDAHAGEFGQRCEGCHETARWAAPGFNADAHRRTNFPLVGRHAVLPCQECHVDARGPVFSRRTVECIGCHQQDFERTRLVSVDHMALGFSTDCRQCHTPWRFQGAKFPGHDTCFQLSRGDHANIPCQGCHTSLAGLTPTGACATRTAACSGCHTHSCTRTDARHANVPGYQCKDVKCYECHRFTVKP